jgi:hypothetical protein
LGAGIAVLLFGILGGFELLTKRSPFSYKNKPTTTPITVITPLTPSGSLDKFGIQMLFATMPGGREWFMNRDDPSSDGIFEAKDQKVSRMLDGHWYASGNPPDYRTRIMIKSPQGTAFWKNVEMTGYFKVVRTYPRGDTGEARAEDSESTFQAYARGGTHSDELMVGSDGQGRYLNAVGSAYKGRIYFNGNAAVAKEIGHSVYAPDRHLQEKSSGEWIRIGKNLFRPLVNNYNFADGQYYGGRWIGLKVVIFDFLENGNEYVRIQTYIDDGAVEDSSVAVLFKPSNNWKLLSDVVDKGDWIDDPGANSKLVGTLDKLIERCGNPFATREDYARNIITWFGHPYYIDDPIYRPIANSASFRWDFCGAEFAYLSVREIGGVR